MSGTENASPTAHRGAAIVIDPAIFTGGAGDYDLIYDILAIESTNGDPIDPGDSADIQIWQGSGYDLSSSSGNALIVDTLSGELKKTGAATAVSNIGSGTNTTTVTDETIRFTYDGTSAVVIFLGANNSNGFPHPTVTFDNIRIASVPEPSTSFVTIFAMGLIASRRKRSE